MKKFIALALTLVMALSLVACGNSNSDNSGDNAADNNGGDTAAITAVGGEGALRCRLLDMGLTPHARVTLQKIAPMGDPIQIQVRGYELTLRREDAARIEVRL